MSSYNNSKGKMEHFVNQKGYLQLIYKSSLTVPFFASALSSASISTKWESALSYLTPE